MKVVDLVECSSPRDGGKTSELCPSGVPVDAFVQPPQEGLLPQMDSEQAIVLSPDGSFTLPDPTGQRRGVWFCREVSGMRFELGGGEVGCAYKFYGRCILPMQIASAVIYFLHLLPPLHGANFHGAAVHISLGVCPIVFIGRAVWLRNNGSRCARLITTLIKAAEVNALVDVDDRRGTLGAKRSSWQRAHTSSLHATQGLRAELSKYLAELSKEILIPMVICQACVIYLCRYGIQQALAASLWVETVFFSCFTAAIPVAYWTGAARMSFADFLLIAVCRLVAFHLSCFSDEVVHIFRPERFVDQQTGEPIEMEAMQKLLRRDLLALAPRQVALDNLLDQVQTLWAADVNGFFLLFAIVPLLVVMIIIFMQDQDFLSLIAVLIVPCIAFAVCLKTLLAVEEPGNIAFRMLNRLATSQMVVDSQGVEMLALLNRREYGIRVYGYRLDFRSKYGVMGIGVAFGISMLSAMLSK